MVMLYRNDHDDGMSDYSMTLGSEDSCYDAPECKSVDSNTRITVAAGPTILPLNLIQAGAERWNRIGRRICLDRFVMRGVVSSTSIQARLMIVYDRQANGSLPALSDVLGGYLQTGGFVSDFTAYKNMDNADRFDILYDSWRVTSTNGGLADFEEDSAARVIVSVPLGKRQTHYMADSSPAVIGDIATGSLLLLYTGSSSMQLTWRLEYSE